MLLLRFGLYLAAIGALYATWASSQAGYPLEVALLRGLLCFMAISVVAYLAELTVVTAPAPHSAQHSDEVPGSVEADGGDGGTEPVSLAAVRAQGGPGAATTSGDRRAA